MLYSRRTTVLFMRHLWMRNSIATEHYLNLPTFPIDLLLYTEQRRATSKSRMCFHYQLTAKKQKECDERAYNREHKHVCTYGIARITIRCGVCPLVLGLSLTVSVSVCLSNKFCRANCAALSLRTPHSYCVFPRRGRKTQLEITCLIDKYNFYLNIY